MPFKFCNTLLTCIKCSSDSMDLRAMPNRSQRLFCIDCDTDNSVLIGNELRKLSDETKSDLIITGNI